MLESHSGARTRPPLEGICLGTRRFRNLPLVTMSRSIEAPKQCLTAEEVVQPIPVFWVSIVHSGYQTYDITRHARHWRLSPLPQHEQREQTDRLQCPALPLGWSSGLPRVERSLVVVCVCRHLDPVMTRVSDSYNTRCFRDRMPITQTLTHPLLPMMALCVYICSSVAWSGRDSTLRPEEVCAS